MLDIRHQALLQAVVGVVGWVWISPIKWDEVAYSETYAHPRTDASQFGAGWVGEAVTPAVDQYRPSEERSAHKNMFTPVPQSKRLATGQVGE